MTIADQVDISSDDSSCSVAGDEGCSSNRMKNYGTIHNPISEGSFALSYLDPNITVSEFFIFFFGYSYCCLFCFETVSD